ncbi:fucose mutarotase [Hydra vulgaris]|uniref:L-fucose mutarotase n=1 Tax=Hydra vulgaris TaxID=6087 RepID=T2MK48_HYDVU|nr:fucose mutarotase [Hydra vulgaris]
MVMLKGIPSILSPELLLVLAKMGHGDEIVLADANFPSASVCKTNGAELIRADGLGCTDLLKAVLELLPLDTYVDAPVFLMERTPSDKNIDLKTPIWDEFKNVVNNAEQRHVCIKFVERFDFYEQAKRACAVVATGEKALYGNIILKKGVIKTSN